MRKQNQEVKGIQSVETGCGILEKIASCSEPLTISEISKLCNMSMSKVHHYLVSLCRVGFLEKEADGRYGVSMKLSMLGLTDTNQVALKKIMEPHIQEFAKSINETVAFSLWGENGPYVVLQEKSSKSINLSIMEDSIMSLATSANGRLFAALYDENKTHTLLEKELSQLNINKTDFYKELEHIRKVGYSVIEGYYTPGFSCIAVPIYNKTEQMIGALSTVGVYGLLDISPESMITLTTMKKAKELSHILGSPT